MRIRAVSCVLIFACVYGCPSPTVQTIPQNTGIAQPTAKPNTPVVAKVEGPTAEQLAQQTAKEAAEKAAQEAAQLREKEEAELKAKEDQRLAEEAKRNATESKITAQYAEAFTLVRAGNDAQAATVYEKTIAEQPESYSAHYNLGVIQERMGNQQRAIELYQKALALKPDYSQASDNLMRLYVRTNQASAAESDLRKRILAFPKDLALRNQFVRALIAQGRNEEAEAEAKRVLKVDELNVDARLNLATIFYRQKKYELSKQVLDQGREIDPSNAAVWNLLAFCQLALDQKGLAIESFRKAAELREDFPEAHNNLGAMLNEVNDCDAAVRELQTAIRYSPDSAQAHLNLGNAYRCSRQYETAQKEYEKALALDPKTNDAFFNLAILYLDGEVPNIEKLDRLKKALAYFDQYKLAQGTDVRYDRYYEETQKGIKKEQDRLSRLDEKKRKDAEKAEKKIKDLEKKRQQWDAQKVGGKVDLP